MPEALLIGLVTLLALYALVLSWEALEQNREQKEEILVQEFELEHYYIYYTTWCVTCDHVTVEDIPQMFNVNIN